MLSNMPDQHGKSFFVARNEKALAVRQKVNVQAILGYVYSDKCCVLFLIQVTHPCEYELSGSSDCSGSWNERRASLQAHHVALLKQ